ncbi:hypothetical protein DIPPA_70125 [Diplonema papillatum]|nr:hypothetical protein DIPPA_70125 [Diplonema papillatum]
MGRETMFRLAALVTIATAVKATTFRYAVLGDWGAGGYEAGAPHEVTSAVSYRDTVQEHDSQFTISTGDNIYCDVNYGIKHSWEETWKKPNSHGGGAWLMTVGNHDNVGPQIAHTKKNDEWIFPQHYFTKEIDTGLNFTMQIWSVDTHSFGGDQVSWLEKSMQESSARWKIIFTHYPWISSGRHKKVPTAVTVAALAKKYGAQVVYNGHDHLLQSMVHEGVMFVGSGATARGAMLVRAAGQEHTDFLWAWGLTFSIGYHGILHVSATKNVMWGHMYSRTNMVHEFITVWDWPFKYKDHCEASKKVACLPSAKTIVQYLNEEADTHSPPAMTEQATPTPTNNVVIKTATEADVQHVTAEQLPGSLLPDAAYPPEKRAVYVAAALCQGCIEPIVNEPFSIWIQGISLTEDHRVVIAHLASECQSTTKNVIDRLHLQANTVNVTVSGTSGEGTDMDMYVCLSGDKGKTFHILTAADTGFNTFTVFAEPPANMPSPVPSTEKGVGHLHHRLQSMITSIRPTPQGGVPWSWVVILVVAAGAGAWYHGRLSARAETRRTLSSVTRV